MLVNTDVEQSMDSPHAISSAMTIRRPKPSDSKYKITPCFRFHKFKIFCAYI